MARSTSPANVWRAITPNDTTDIPKGSPSGIVCGVGGTVVLVDYLGNEMTRTFEAEVIYVYMPVKIKATGTSATGIFGLWN